MGEFRNWSRVSDSPPEPLCNVLAYFPDIHRVCIAHECAGYWHDETGEVICDPKKYPRAAVAASHWMTLPLAPGHKR